MLAWHNNLNTGLCVHNLSKMIYIREIKQRVPLFFKTEKGG